MIFNLYRSTLVNQSFMENNGCASITLLDRSKGNCGRDDCDVTRIGIVEVPESVDIVMSQTGGILFDHQGELIQAETINFNFLPEGWKKIMTVNAEGLDLQTWFNENIVPQYDLEAIA